MATIPTGMAIRAPRRTTIGAAIGRSPGQPRRAACSWRRSSDCR
jgi:hypothetical protein